MSEVSVPGAEGQGNLLPFNAITKQILRHLDQQIDAAPPACPGLEDHETLGPERLVDIRTRFMLWTGNLGVMRRPEDPRALDRRLIDAPDVANRDREILKDLQDLLSQSGRPCDCNATNDSVAHEVHSMDEEDAMMMQLLGLKTSKGCTTSWLSASLNDALRRLFHLSALISKSSTRDKFARAGIRCKLEMYEPYDIQHVREKVAHAGGRANAVLVKRLGKANTSRRQFIEYSRKHTAELNNTVQGEDYLLNQGPTDASDKSPHGQSVDPTEKTNKTDAQTKASTLGPIDPNEFDYSLDDARSCTTVATSIVDGKAFSGLKAPELTQYAKPGAHFICPLCRTYQRFNGQTAWRRHVFSDIRAYVCTSPKCGMLMFGSFNTWRSHELDHRLEWFCPLCNLLHHDKSKAKLHLMHHHGELAEQHDVNLLLQTSSRPSEHLPAGDCPFCDWGVTLREQNRTPKEHDLTVPSRQFMKHLGRHLEEIALFVIPQAEEEQRGSGDTASNASHAILDQDSATGSTLSSFESQPSIGASVSFKHGEEPPPISALTDTNPDSPSEPLYCVCDEIAWGSMIACDNEMTCEKEWFHLPCVGLYDLPPRGTKWYCPDCREKLKLDTSTNGLVGGFPGGADVKPPPSVSVSVSIGDSEEIQSDEAGPTSPDTSLRYTEFSLQDPGFFSCGRVFDVLWAEPGVQDTMVDSVTKAAMYQRPEEKVYFNRRRFAVIREGADYCSALPISTYNGQGVAKLGVNKSEHAIIYAGQDDPSAGEHELPKPGEAPMTPVPIRVELDDKSARLDSMSRINFGEVHVIRHNIKTKSFGRIDKRFLRDISQYVAPTNSVPMAAPQMHFPDANGDFQMSTTQPHSHLPLIRSVPSPPLSYISSVHYPFPLTIPPSSGLQISPDELFVHEYRPRAAAIPQESAVGSGPKYYTFANQTPEHFGKGKRSPSNASDHNTESNSS